MRVFSNLVFALAWCAAALFVAAGVMLSYEVVARYFFTAPTIWAAELSQMSLIWGSLIAMPWILSARRHITVTAIISLLPPRARQVCELIAMVAILLFSFEVALWSWDIFYDSFVRGRTTGSLMNLPIWITELAIPFGFAILCVQCVVEIVRVVRHGPSDVDIVHE